ncbi:MAG: tetratricopeptide repeat protein [Planctomycetota bacterium]
MICRLCIVSLFFGAITPACPASEPVVGQTVTNIETIELRGVDGKRVDLVGPGEVLRVIAVERSRVLVSRGKPGWVSEDDILPLAEAQSRLANRFRTGAGPTEYLARGNIRVALGELELGLADLQKAVEYSGDPADYLPALGYGLLRNQQHGKAIQTFSRAIDLDRKIAAAHMGRGLAYFQAGQLSAAETDFAHALEIESNNAFALKYAG